MNTAIMMIPMIILIPKKHYAIINREKKNRLYFRLLISMSMYIHTAIILIFHVILKFILKTFILSYSTTLSLTDDTHEDLINVQDDEDNLDEDEDEDEFIDFKLLTNTQPLWILPLYSLLPSHKQARVNT